MYHLLTPNKYRSEPQKPRKTVTTVHSLYTLKRMCYKTEFQDERSHALRLRSRRFYTNEPLLQSMSRIQTLVIDHQRRTNNDKFISIEKPNANIQSTSPYENNLFAQPTEDS